MSNIGSKCLQPNVDMKKHSQLTKVKPTQNQTQALVFFEIFFSKKLKATNSYHAEKNKKMKVTIKQENNLSLSSFCQIFMVFRWQILYQKCYFEAKNRL